MIRAPHAMPTLCRSDDSPQSAGRADPKGATIARLRQNVRRLQAENTELRREITALRSELADLMALAGDLDPDGSRTYAWLLGIEP